jgi:hypothetical protein
LHCILRVKLARALKATKIIHTREHSHLSRLASQPGIRRRQLDDLHCIEETVQFVADFDHLAEAATTEQAELVKVAVKLFFFFFFLVCEDAHLS